MSRNIKALAIAGAVLWGGGFLLIGLGNLMFSGYGTVFLGCRALVPWRRSMRGVCPDHWTLVVYKALGRS